MMLIKMKLNNHKLLYYLNENALKINMITRQNILQIIVFFFTISGLSIQASGQDEGGNNTSPYLFEEFSPAAILFKDGSIKQAKFNYNMATEEMVYVDKVGLWHWKCLELTQFL